jgi:hypothetical protein
MTKYHLLREARKLIDILDTWGNVLVPTIPGQTETCAHDRLMWILSQLRDDYGVTTQEDLQMGIASLSEA